MIHPRFRVQGNGGSVIGYVEFRLDARVNGECIRTLTSHFGADEGALQVHADAVTTGAASR